VPINDDEGKAARFVLIVVYRHLFLLVLILIGIVDLNGKLACAAVSLALLASNCYRLNFLALSINTQEVKHTILETSQTPGA
jgi:small-conductance mechanosensitive channel